MSKAKKSALPGVIAGLFVLLIIGGVVLYMNLGNVAKSLSETIGSETLGVPVKIAKMEIVPHEKRIEVDGLKIGNPSGYKNAQSMSVDRILVIADSLSQDLLVFNEIAIEGTNLNLEVTEKGTNFSDLQKNIKPKTSADQTTASGKPIKVIIKKLTLNGATLNPSVTMLSNEIKPVTMPDIKLTGIGQKTNGVLVSEAVAQILDHVTKVATQTASRQGLLQGMDAAALKDLSGQMHIDTGAGKALLDNATDSVKGLKDSLKGMF